MECERPGYGQCFERRRLDDAALVQGLGVQLPVKRKHEPLGMGARVLRGGAAAVRHALALPADRSDRPAKRSAPADPPSLPPAPLPNCDPATPFISDMDEITYWIYTKRAPCLMNYDNMIKKQNMALDFVAPRPCEDDVSSPKKKKRRKLSILDDESDSIDKQQNVYFESGNNHKTVLSSCKSATFDSDIDFNIRNTSIQNNAKRKNKSHKHKRTVLHKKNKLTTSTPNQKMNSAVRRSLRKTPNCVNNKSNQFAVSFDVYTVQTNNDCMQEVKKEETNVSCREALISSNTKMEAKDPVRPNNDAVVKGQFEDDSDVSGFTANYIRSTKIHSSKNPKTLRTKNSRLTLVKETKQENERNGNAPLVCVNKSVNTGSPPAKDTLNCSTDSSQNIINLVTVESNDNSPCVNKSTSLLKFIDAKPSKSNNKKQTSSKVDNNISNTSFNSGTVRYPKRQKAVATAVTCTPQQRSSTRQRVTRNSSGLDTSDRKENSDLHISRTRSGRRIGLALQKADSSVQVLSMSDQISSPATLNVVVATQASTRKKKRSSNVKTVKQRDSIRSKSGFAACFSDSDDDDSELLKQRKFFDT